MQIAIQLLSPKLEQAQALTLRFLQAALITSVTGTYGTLTIGADGSYTYVADQAAADALDLNDSVTDTFVYTITDDASSPRSPLTDSATLTITVLGINDTPTAVNLSLIHI